jgi:guanyl-specific ribonuclease Sa
MRVVGGSSVKPTSNAKKEMALEVGQVLGQFVNAAPQAVTSVMLKVFSSAFEEVVITEEDWASVAESVNQQQQQQQPQPGQNAQGGQQGAPSGESIEQIVGQLPPEAQQAVQQAIQQGVPPEVAVQKVLEMLQGGQQPPQQ